MREMTDLEWNETEDLYERILIDTAELAALLGVSKGLIEKERANIIGARQLRGKGRWFFDPKIIRQRVESGQDIFVKT
jgi:hypothetical protein